MTYVDSQGIIYSKENDYYVVGIDSYADNNADQSAAVVFANIPARINGIEVKVVGQFAFRYSTTLKSIFIPYTVTEMRFDALAHNQNLIHVEFAENSRLKILGRGIFYNTAVKIIQSHTFHFFAR